MSRPITSTDDLKSALLLSGGFALAAAATVPAMLPSLPPEARELPLPMPLFCVVLAAQLAVVYGLLGWAGMRLARGRGREPAPWLTSWWMAAPRPPTSHWLAAGGLGLACGILLIGVVAVIQRIAPGTLPPMLHPPSPAAALAASTAGSFGEEILCRLFVLSLVARVLPQGRAGTAAAIAISSLAFAAAHSPAFIMLFGGFEQVPALGWLWVLVLNGLLGAVFGQVFLRWGIGAAILAHFSTDCVWHVATQLATA